MNPVTVPAASPEQTSAMDHAFPSFPDQYPLSVDLPADIGYPLQDELHHILPPHSSPMLLPPDLAPSPFPSPTCYYPAGSLAPHHQMATSEASLVSPALSQPPMLPPSYDAAAYSLACSRADKGVCHQASQQLASCALPQSGRLPQETLKRTQSLTRPARPIFPISATPIMQGGKSLPTLSDDYLRQDSNLYDPVLASATNTPSGSPNSLSTHSPPPTCSVTPAGLETDIEGVFADQIWRLDQEILKLFSDRSQLLLRAQRHDTGQDLLLSPQPTAKVPLFLARTGIATADSVFARGNTLIAQMSQLRQEYTASLEKLLYHSLGDGDLEASIQYIRSVLQPDRGLRLSTQSGVYHLSLDSLQFATEGSKIMFCLDSVNALLRTAQALTSKASLMDRILNECQVQLQTVCDSNEGWGGMGALDPDQQKWVRNICSGNSMTLHLAGQQWLTVMREAKKAIEIITSGLL